MAKESLPASVRKLFDFLVRRRGRDVRCRVLFVCTANICRSPTAEAVFRDRIRRDGLSRQIECDSAGTHDVNLGRFPDGRARAAAAKRGIDFSRRRVRQVCAVDFERFDLILAMDGANLEALRERCPPELAPRLGRLMEFSGRSASIDVPDPYYGNAKAFEIVLDMVEEACTGLLEHIRATYLGGANPRGSE